MPPLQLTALALVTVASAVIVEEIVILKKRRTFTEKELIVMI